MLFGNDNRPSFMLAVFAMSFVFIVTIGRVLDAGVATWAVVALGIVGGATTLGVGFLKR